MKKYFSIIKVFIIALFGVLASCVHDDNYAAPDLNQCQDEAYFTDPKNEFVKWSLADLKAKTPNVPFTENAYVEGYVSSTDESGNIYKYLYIQDSPNAPTQGLVVSANAVSMYAKYPQGYKVYIKLKGLAMGTYGNAKQLGYYGLNTEDNVVEFGRIPEKMVFSSIVRSCTEKATIVPKEMTLLEIRNMLTKPTKPDEENQYLGCLIKIPNAEFDARALCSIYAPDGFTVDRAINDATYTNPTTATAVVRNSGFASFASQTIPSGKGDFIGILSKYNSSIQLYINKVSDLSGMKNFPRKDGLTADPCSFDPTTATLKSIADVKKLVTSTSNNSNVLISDNIYIKAKVTANDETANIYRFVYTEDATGGIRVNINKASKAISQDPRFKVGKTLIVNLKGLYIGRYNGEFQIGTQSGASVGFIADADVYKYLFDAKEGITTITPTEIKIADITPDVVGKWVKIKNVQFADSELGNTFSGNRILVDCSGNKVIVRTNTQASFANAMLDSGKGDIYAIVSVYNGTYQLIIPHQYNADLDGARCDGTVPPSIIFWDAFDAGLGSWTTVNVEGEQVWTTSITSGNNYAKMSGYASGNFANEDWLISPEVNLNGYKSAFVSLDSDYNFAGNVLETYITTNYTGDVKTTTWTPIAIPLDTTSGWGFYNSGNVSLDKYLGQKVRIAFKYTSTTASASTWEIDNFSIKGVK
jgi:hypothetical protein